MKKNIFLITGLFFLLNTFFLFGQSQPIDHSFRPVFSAGLVGSQVDGDTYAGYNKLGGFLGLGINRQLTKTFELEFALTFIQKGARKNYYKGADSAAIANGTLTFYLSRLNYLEIPLTLKINYKKFKAEVGGAVGYLIKNPPTVETQNATLPDYGYKNFDLSYILGVGYKLSSSWLVNVRFEYSVLPIRPYFASYAGIYHGQFPFSLFNRGLYNNLLQLSLNYRLPSKNPTTNTNVQP